MHTHALGEIVCSYLRKSSALCVSEYGRTHTRIVIIITLVFFHCEMKKLTDVKVTMHAYNIALHIPTLAACDESFFCKAKVLS